MAAVIDCARYEMTTLYQQLGDPELAVVLTDTDGVILHMVTSQDFERVVQPLGLQVGRGVERGQGRAPTAWAPASSRPRRWLCSRPTTS